MVASAPTGDNGWYTSDVDVDFTATDALSGLDSATQRVTSSGEGAAVEVSSPAFTDRAGNTTPAGAVTKTFKVDKTAPAIPTFVGGPSGTRLLRRRRDHAHLHLLRQRLRFRLVRW